MTDLTLQEQVEIFVKKQKILKKDFAESIGISPIKLSHWLKGRVLLSRRTLEKVVAILDKYT